MSTSTKKSVNLQRKELLKLKLKLKPYILDYERFNEDLINNYIEFKDSKNFRNAAIKELIIKKPISIPDLTELLKNPNIKKISFKNEYYKISVHWLLFFSKLLRKNSFIKEIELCLDIRQTYNNIQKMAWSYFFNTVSRRLVKITDCQFSYDNSDINKLLFSISSLKVINLILGGNEYSNIIKNVLCSKKNLYMFTIDDKGITNINQQFFNCISKSKKNAKVNTLVLENISSEKSLLFIDNAYLFNIETIKISVIPDYEEKVLDHILKLSNNPLNTVKRIKIDIDNFSQIISNLLDSKKDKYSIQKIPKILIHGYKEVIIDKNYTDNTSKVYCLYENSNYGSGFYYNFKLTFIDNSLDVDNYTELIYIIFNCPHKLNSLLIKYDDKKLGFADSKSIIENADSIVIQMKRIFNKFLENNILPLNQGIESLAFELKYPEFNIFYFTILEILGQLKISIIKLSLEYCSAMEFVDLMNKITVFGTLNINIIDLHITEVNKEHIDRLYQYSHLIEGKIYLRYHNEIDLSTKRAQAEHLYLNSQLINNSNFIFLYREDNPLLFFDKSDQWKNELSIPYIKKIQNENEIIGSNIYIIKDIRFLRLNLYKTSLELLNETFSLLKKYHYHLNKIEFDLYWFGRASKLDSVDISKIVSMYLETNLDYKYREKGVYCFQSKIDKHSFEIFTRKNKKHFKLLHSNLDR